MLVRVPATYVSTIRPLYQCRLLHQITSTIRTPAAQQPTAYRPLYIPAAASQSPTRPSHVSAFSTSAFAMSSDDAYMDFLNKANSDLKAGQGSQQGGDSIKTQTVDTSLNLPASLKNVDVYYVSETDEPFEPVLLRWKEATQGKWPSADEFSSLISPNEDVSKGISTLSASSFDPKNQYTAVLDAVRSALSGDSDIKVYRVEITSTKLEYFVVALDSEEGGRVIGLRAKAVET